MTPVAAGLDRLTVKVMVPAPSLTETSLMENCGVPSLSVMVPVPATPPMLSGTVSFRSDKTSCTVGTMTVKLLTPSGTVRMLPIKVTPFEKIGTPMSLLEAVPPPTEKG